jgi:predicted site-specific integrase-resolvase
MNAAANRRSLERLLNAREVAEFLGVKKTMVYRFLGDGPIPTVNISDSPCRCTLRVRPSALQNWIEKREVA